jgi:hypothetical protein
MRSLPFVPCTVEVDGMNVTHNKYFNLVSIFICIVILIVVSIALFLSFKSTFLSFLKLCKLPSAQHS